MKRNTEIHEGVFCAPKVRSIGLKFQIQNCLSPLWNVNFDKRGGGHVKWARIKSQWRHWFPLNFTWKAFLVFSVNIEQHSFVKSQSNPKKSEKLPKRKFSGIRMAFAALSFQSGGCWSQSCSVIPVTSSGTFLAYRATPGVHSPSTRLRSVRSAGLATRDRQPVFPAARHNLFVSQHHDEIFIYYFINLYLHK